MVDLVRDYIDIYLDMLQNTDENFVANLGPYIKILNEAGDKRQEFIDESNRVFSEYVDNIQRVNVYHAKECLMNYNPY